jgi:UDP-N-acetylmuramoyl-tripeptide--D-alanyl-D-alanine ligase
VPCLVVADPLVALGRLARALVDRGQAADLRVVGITGSQGKTSTKDLLSQVLEAAGPTVAPVGNLNNELGVPLTVCRVEPDTRFLVAEMGARGIGHIAYLCQIAPPRVGVVLNVGQAHLGEFGGKAAIAQAKGELVEALPESGVAVLNADDPLVWGMRERTVAGVLGFAADQPPPGPGVWSSAVTADALGRASFTLHRRQETESDAEVEVQLQVSGRHQVGNALAAAAAALALGLDLDQVGAALSGATARSRWRMEIAERGDGLVVVNDAYNANPDSMRAAVDTLDELGRTRPGRTWAVLGDMLELGEAAEAEHAEIGRYVARTGVDRLIAVGTYASVMSDAAHAAGLDEPGAVRAYPDKESLLTGGVDGPGTGDVVLVKASRGLALDTVAEAILSAAGGRAEGHPT